LLIKNTNIEYEESTTNTIKIAQIPKLPVLSIAVMDHVSIYEVFVHVIETIKEDFFNPFNLFDTYLCT